MAISMWEGLNIGIEFDQDEETSNLAISLDHDELKGEVSVELKTLLSAELDDIFDEDQTTATMQDVTLPIFEGMKEYFEDCIKLIEEKISEAKGFIDENPIDE